MSLQSSEVPINVYQAALDSGILIYQFSLSAGLPVFPPRLLCPFTSSESLEWRESRGWGTVYALTQIMPRSGEPYCVALIDVDEGFRMMSRLQLSATRPPCIGDRVRFFADRLSEAGPMLPLFRQEEAADA